MTLFVLSLWHEIWLSHRVYLTLALRFLHFRIFLACKSTTDSLNWLFFRREACLNFIQWLIVRASILRSLLFPRPFLSNLEFFSFLVVKMTDLKLGLVINFIILIVVRLSQSVFSVRAIIIDNLLFWLLSWLLLVVTFLDAVKVSIEVYIGDFGIYHNLGLRWNHELTDLASSRRCVEGHAFFVLHCEKSSNWLAG